ncbi:SA1362 family protein [Bacillus dakarensis]|uniref:SA1362 family protein n=1 Tax=Robertmurraya dakarensis TaxID=1926278 RepID=UPI000981B562|nr:SA1362 family protein [Bacillus dakarensis]
MKNRTSLYFVIGLVTLAIIGVASKFISDPLAFLQSIFVFLIIGVVIFYLVRRFNGASPQKREQSAFRKAAKMSKKRYKQNDQRKPIHKKAGTGNITTLKRTKHKSKSATHLTVIDGKKGKKKNRASF